MPKNLHDADNILLNGTQRFFVENKLLDVKVSWKDEVLLKCHKIVLASFSSYFETLLEGTTGCAILSLDAVKDEYVEHLQNIVKFMYGHNITIKRKNCRQLLEGAKIFGVTALIKLLELNLSKPPTSNDDENITLKSFAVGSVLLVHFQRFKDYSKFVDVKISCQNRVLFSCHKLVLAAFSSYFESLLVKTEGCAILNLDAVDSLYVSQLEILLNFMYGRSVFGEQTDFDLLKDAAKVFGIHSMDKINFVPSKKRPRKERDLHSSTKVSSKEIPSSKADETEFDHLYQSEGNVAASIVQQQVKNLPSSSLMTGTFQRPDISQKNVPPVATKTLTPTIAKTKMSLPLTSAFPQATKDKPNKQSHVELPCQICGEIVNSGTESLEHLEKHFSSTESIERPSTSVVPAEQYTDNYFCQKCSLIFETETDFANHFLSCGKNPNQSQDFPESLTTMDEFRTSSDGRPTVSCSVCGWLVENSTLKEHMQECHSSSIVCNICNQTFSDRSKMHDHLVTTHKLSIFSCDLCSKTFKTDLGYKNHREMHKSVVYKCELCDFKTKTKTYLNLHMIKYHETTLSGRTKGKKFACSQCGLTFIFDSLLKRHYQSKHLKLKPYQCPYCEYSASENAAVKLHIRSAHTYSKPFACNMCNYRSTNSSALASHRRRHTGEKPYRCDQCEACFSEKRDLTVHKTKDHDKARPFACNQCELKFYRKDFLLVHMRTLHGTFNQQATTQKA